MKKTIGILAHVDAGKTTFSEQILYHTNSIRKRGRVDHKDSFLDSDDIEKRRGITIFSDIGMFSYDNNDYYLIDTPGHIDFSAEMERSLDVLDYAILIISAVEGIQGHTEAIIELLNKKSIKTFIFINKTDRDCSDVDDILLQLSKRFNFNLVEINNALEDELDEQLIEKIAENDEYLLENYFNGKYNKNNWIKSLKEQVNQEILTPLFKGSALFDKGINEFLDWFNFLTETKYDQSLGFTGRVFKVKYDSKNNRLAYIKALSGKISSKEFLEFNINGKCIEEQINDIKKCNGNKFIKVNFASAGDIFTVSGLKNVKSGMGIGIDNLNDFEMIPTMEVKVLYDENINPKEVLKCFKILEDEESTLNVKWNEKFSEIRISIVGEVQLEVIKERIKNKFNQEINFGEPKILYKETIKGKRIGYGHFEPLGHYSEVHLLIEEGIIGSGITFESKCHTDNLTIGNQNLIKTHIFEREHKGILTGSTVTDLKITLLTGRSHNKHTSGGDFREATKRALRQGLEGGNNILLEPIYKFTLNVKDNIYGKILSDIQRIKGEISDTVNINGRVIVKGFAPVKTLMNYLKEFQAIIGGNGSISVKFSGYKQCHNSEDVIKEINYDKKADIEYTSSSIFCSKGQAYVVKGRDAKDYMHCLK